MKTITILTILLVLFGCSGPSTAPQYGKWKGNYYALTVPEHLNISSRGPAELSLTNSQVRLILHGVEIPVRILENTSNHLTLFSDPLRFEISRVINSADEWWMWGTVIDERYPQLEGWIHLRAE